MLWGVAISLRSIPRTQAYVADKFGVEVKPDDNASLDESWGHWPAFPGKKCFIVIKSDSVTALIRDRVLCYCHALENHSPCVGHLHVNYSHDVGEYLRVCTESDYITVVNTQTPLRRFSTCDSTTGSWH
jgi:hypothetical protein